MFPEYRSALKKATIGVIGLVCVVAACAMLWVAMTPERASGTHTWVLFSLLGMFVLPLVIGAMLLLERSHRHHDSGSRSTQQDVEPSRSARAR